MDQAFVGQTMVDNIEFYGKYHELSTKCQAKNK